MHNCDGIIEILKNIMEGIDPSTGEVFDPRDLFNRPELHRVTKDLDGIAAGKKKLESRNRLKRPSAKIFEALKAWRYERAVEEGIPAYCIFSDKDLWSIAEGDVCKKEDLLSVNGVSDRCYEAYGDEVFEIISDFM